MEAAARSARGSTAVEFALVAPLLLLILLFMIDAGRALFVIAGAQNAAHQAASVLASGGAIKDAKDIAGVAAEAAMDMADTNQNKVDLTAITLCPVPFVAEDLAETTVEISLDFNFFTPIELIQQFDPGASDPGTIQITQRATWLCAG